MNISMTDGTVTLSEGNLAQTITNSKGEKVSQIKGSCKSIPIGIDIMPKEGYIIEYFRQNSTTLLENAEAQSNYKIYPSKGDNFFIKFKKKKTTYTWTSGYYGTGTILTEPDWLVNNPDGSQNIRTGGNNAGASMQDVLREPFEMTFESTIGTNILFGFEFENKFYSAGIKTPPPWSSIETVSFVETQTPREAHAYWYSNPQTTAVAGTFGLRVLIDGTVEYFGSQGKWIEISNFNAGAIFGSTASPANYTKKSPLTTGYRPFIAYGDDNNGAIWFNNLTIKSLKP